MRQGEGWIPVSAQSGVGIETHPPLPPQYTDAEGEPRPGIAAGEQDRHPSRDRGDQLREPQQTQDEVVRDDQQPFDQPQTPGQFLIQVAGEGQRVNAKAVIGLRVCWVKAWITTPADVPADIPSQTRGAHQQQWDAQQQRQQSRDPHRRCTGIKQFSSDPHPQIGPHRAGGVRVHHHQGPGPRLQIEGDLLGARTGCGDSPEILVGGKLRGPGTIDLLLSNTGIRGREPLRRR